ncbi:MAG: calcium-binding protein, partial [Thermoleophilaceae bacterium]
AVFAAADAVVTSGCQGTNAAGEVNALRVETDDAGDVVFRDSVAITDGDGPSGCTVTGSVAVCAGATGYRFDLGDSGDSAVVAVGRSDGVSTGGAGNDTLTGGPGADELDGGPGPDTISGGPGDDVLEGGAGGDVVSGGDGNDTFDGGGLPGGCQGGEGDDQLNGDAGADGFCGGPGPTATGGSDDDVIAGGDGIDHVFYPRLQPVNVSLDGARNDGQAGEADNVSRDVEDVTGGATGDTLSGDDDPNLLDGAGGPDTLNGGGGDDTLVDSGGDSAGDTLNGGDGDDTMSAGLGPDSYNGGDGEDALLDYAGRTQAVTVTLDGVADDGGAGEGDNVGADVEDVTGGAAGDTLTGNDADNELAGGGGRDTIAGGGGNDGLSGGAGSDTIDGGTGRDRLDGGGGADTLMSRDGQTDRDECGGGTDSVQAEGRDDISGDCEKLDIAPPTAVAIGTVVVTRTRYVVVGISCPDVERTCAGLVIVKSVRRIGRVFIKLGQVGYRLHGGDQRAIRAQIPKGYLAALKRKRRVRVRAVVTNNNPDTGGSTAATKIATVTTRGL